jgi:HSP20 family protein
MRLVSYSYPTLRSLVPFGRSPWSGLEAEVDRLLRDGNGAATRSVPVELGEDKENVYVRAELPGVNREDISVELAEGALKLGATRKTKFGEREETVTFARDVDLGDTAVQADKISATYVNGVLTVTVPKREQAQPLKIAVS